MSYPYPDDTGGERRLQELKPQINAAHEAAEEAVRSTLEYAHNCGELLERAKVLAGHGNWERWRDEHFAGSAATAQLYQYLYRNRDLLVDPKTQRVRDLSLREARRVISEAESSEGDADDDSEGEEATTAAEKPGKKGGKSKGPKGPGRCDPPAAVIYGATHLPVPDEELAAAIREGQALILRSNAPNGGEKALEAAKAHVENGVRAQWAAGYDAHLAVVCGSDVSSLERGCAAVESAVAGEGDEEPSEKSVAQYEKRAIREADKDELTLYQAVMARGGIKPRPGVGEYSEVPICYLRKDGLPADEMGSELGEDCPKFGIRDEDTLIAALAARRKAA